MLFDLTGTARLEWLPMRIGPYSIQPRVILAPMAGVTDKPFRQLCKRMGAGLAVSEMTTSDARLWDTKKSRWRMDHVGEPAPISVQIAGYDPQQLADAARFNVDHGADIIDINIGSYEPGPWPPVHRCTSPRLGCPARRLHLRKVP